MRVESPAPIRVLLATAATERGGAEVVIEQIVGRLDPARHVAVLATPTPGRLSDQWRARGWPVAPMSPLARLRRIDRGVAIVHELAAAITSQRIDVVHAHGVAAHIHAGLAARRTRRPAIYHAHDVFDLDRTTNGLLHRLALHVPSAVVVAISETVAASLRARVPADRLEVVMDGVDSDIVAPINLPGPPGLRGPLIVWCGRLQHWKGAHLFIEAARHIHAARPDACFAIIGGTLFGLEPEYARGLRSQVADAGLSHVIEFVGHVDDARPWLRASTLVMHCTTRPEPFGLVMAEAMMQARPVVAFRQGGAAEIVADGVTGMLVAPGDKAALARAAIGLLSDDTRRHGMGDAARRRALACFDASAMARRVGTIYDRLAPRNASPGAMPVDRD
jgi:glycosyltransferase involved in cell wall biosynthesis